MLPVVELIELAHERGALVLLDGAQAVSHVDVDVQALDCDFYAFSGHKLYGPTGIGALYGKERLLDGMPPYQGGGDMIRSVTFEETIYNELPYKFEAGTPNIAGAIGLGAAIDYVNGIGIDRIVVSAKPEPGTAHDLAGLLSNNYDAGPGTVYLVRPDQHVAARWRRFDAGKVRAAVSRAISAGA